MREREFLMKVMSVLLIFTTTLLPLRVYSNGDPIISAGKAGQAYGNELRTEALNSPANIDGGMISIPGGTSFNINELYPGSNPKNADRLDEYFPGGNSGSAEDISSVYDSDERMGELGKESKSTLWEDANSNKPSVVGEAYALVNDSQGLSKPNLKNDPVFNMSQGVFDNLDDISKEFGDCTVNDTFEDITMNVHNPEYEVCNRVVDKTASCEINHSYEASVLRHHSGPFNLKSCGDGCLEAWIGRQGDNYWGGWCKIYTAETVYKVTNPDAIISAVIDYAEFDDYMQISVGDTLAYTGPHGSFPEIYPGWGGWPQQTSSNGLRCELSKSWKVNPQVNVTNALKSVKPGSTVPFKIRVSVSNDENPHGSTGGGEGFARMVIRYDPSKVITNDSWYPDECIEVAEALADGFADGSAVCTDDPAKADGCVYTDGVKICPEYFKPSPLSWISPTCKNVSVNGDYNFYKGEMDCYIDAQGNKQCPINEGGNLDSCQKYEDNPQCGFISSNCVNGATGASGTCYVQEEVWDCGSSVDINTIKKNTTYQCGGPIRCMGDECIDLEASKDQTSNFAKASALLNAAQFMTSDLQCTGTDEDGVATGDEDVTCSAFGGEPGQCKIAVGGVSDCCEKPSNVGMSEYLSMIMAVPKLDAAITSLGSENVVRSSYEVLANPIKEQWSAVTKPFTSRLDNVTGAVSDVFSPVTEMKDQAVNFLNEQMQGLMDDLFGELTKDLTQEAATAAAESANQSMGEQGGQAAITNGPFTSMMSGIMTAYTIYVVTIAVIQMVYACEKEEFEMNAKRATDSCTFVGSYCKTKVLGMCIEKRQSYCCFNSPLARIIQEQVRPQFGWSFGSPESPTCGGIPINKFKDIDWDKVNLDEWLALLQQHGQFPNAGDVNIESLTGSGSVFENPFSDEERLNFEERTKGRLDMVDVDERRQEAMEAIGINTGAPIK